MAVAGVDELRVLLLGKTGSGKSSVGNTLMGADYFRVGRGMSSGTEKCSWHQILRKTFRLGITDTPGLCDTHRSQEEIIVEIGKCVGVCAPGPHIVLLVFRCDKRFTKEEIDAYFTLKKLFGEDICRYMIVVFAGADGLDINPDNQQEVLKGELQKNPGGLEKILDDAAWRIFAVNNKATPEHMERQAQQMFDMMSNLRHQNRGSVYSNRMCEEIKTQVEALVDTRMARDKVSREEAERRVRLAIVQEKLGATFVNTIVELVRRGIPAEQAVEIAALCNPM